MAPRKRDKKLTIDETGSESGATASTLPARQKALVFISHDSRDADLAEAFGNLLSDVSGGTLKSFRSSDKKGNTGIEFGAEWYAAIMSQLSDATDVVALLTPQSLDRPWILYEAGVAKGKLETTVFGVALGVPLEKVSTGPFGQFQNCGDDEDSLTKLAMQLLQRNPDAAPREEAVRMQVRIFRETINKILNTKGKIEPLAAANEEQNVAKLFEEIKAMVRELPEQVDEKVQFSSPRGGKRSRRFHPMMIEELMFHPIGRDKENAPTGFLVMISMLRDDFPWLYDLGIELYRAMRSGNKQRIQEARILFFEVVHWTSRSKLIRELIRSDDDESLFMLRRLPEMMERLFDRDLMAPTHRSIGKEKPPNP